MFKSNNKNKKTTPMIIFWTYFTSFSSVSIVDSEQVNICWGYSVLKTEVHHCYIIGKMYEVLCKKCPYSDFFWSIFSRIRSKIRTRKLQIRIIFMQWHAKIWILHKKKWSFPFRITSENVTNLAVSCGFGHIYWRNL